MENKLDHADCLLQNFSFDWRSVETDYFACALQTYPRFGRNQCSDTLYFKKSITE
jgi:hypothetical protein